jgi:hypothetical protein
VKRPAPFWGRRRLQRLHDTDADRGRVTHDDYVSSVLEALDDESDPVVLVGRFSPAAGW